MNKMTAVTTALATTPWWFFPGLDVARECFTCYLIGQLFSVPVFMLVAIGLTKLMGD